MYKQYRSRRSVAIPTHQHKSVLLCYSKSTSPLALADCDNGGISNIIECQNGVEVIH
ncbi:MAG: hypothetical protein IPH96_13285 [Saprospiraceae bacterium]|nr:hypothetical protein [Saprospiraceae bacterium]